MNPEHSDASTSKNRVTEENTLTSIYFIGKVVYPCALLTCYNLCLTREERFFNYYVSKLLLMKKYLLKKKRNTSLSS